MSEDTSLADLLSLNLHNFEDEVSCLFAFYFFVYLLENYVYF